VLGNVWDAPSARLFEDAGMQAVESTGAGIATGHGNRDVGFLQPTV
jgi:2-methylisocitrate lyase-like PEP mutase family enzyme